MKTQVAKMIHKGVYKVIYNDMLAINPYRVYYTADGSCKLVAKYADMASAMTYLRNVLLNLEGANRP